MSTYIQNFKKFRPLLEELVSRDIKIKYRRSVLGVLWTVLNPLFMMVILSIVFSNLFRFDIENYPVYILSGQVIYNFYSGSTSSAMSAMLDNAALLKKVYIPKYLFVMSRILSAIIDVLASHCALLIVMIVTGVEMRWTIILFPIPLFMLVLFCFGFGLILATVAVKFRDIIHLYGVFTTGLMYLTPVIYALSLLPDWLYRVVRLNPITNYLMIYRDVMLNGTLPDPMHVLVGLAEGAVMMILGLLLFAKKQDTFILNL
ncbi:MAG TPA: ABC transporter permease [Candidatus Scatomonas pullistercoris]|uniref:Transport permease protein n=1 Tax=Candidatus Scatomonas pullistercoris TaxID=2840920 RepID=A0A9D1P2C4_9FIRM|nr:ABC transporter permease [Candidatus Scatomonas pullistercoris]